MLSQFCLIFSSSYESLQMMANYLLEHTKYRPKVALICGTGFSGLAENLENRDIIPYEKIPNFPVSTVEGHAGQMVFGTVDNVHVMCMQGRFHYFEGYTLQQCCLPIRIMKLIGITHLVATNASGGLNYAYKTGDLVIMKDHINLLGLCGKNPLIGPNLSLFGPRFLSMNKAYDRDLRKLAMEIVHELGIEQDVHEGVYVCCAGPTFETVAEAQMLKNLGGDCVGMSTVHEVSKEPSPNIHKYYIIFANVFFLVKVITAKHCDMNVVAISFISNRCVLEHDSEDEVAHDEVLAVAKKRQPILSEFMRRLLTRINVK